MQREPLGFQGLERSSTFEQYSRYQRRCIVRSVMHAHRSAGVANNDMSEEE